MIERLLFKRVELWFVLLLLIVILSGSVLLAWAVKQRVVAGERLGFLGDLASLVADFPSDVKKVLGGDDVPTDFVTSLSITRSDDQTYRVASEGVDWPNSYRELAVTTDGWDRRPLYWKADNVDGLLPLLVMLRKNEDKDEEVLVFDGGRNLAISMPVPALNPPKTRKAPYGVSYLMLADGSHVSFPYRTNGLYRNDRCGRRRWTQAGIYHHHYSVADGILGILGLPGSTRGLGQYPQWNSSEIVNLFDVETGELWESISLLDIVKANAGTLDPFIWNNWRDKLDENGVLKLDYVHLNKVEILSEALADEYPDFEGGSILLSARNLNLLLIFDPETLKILWYSSGRTQWQHDPRFIGNNRIMVFNNASGENSGDPSARENFSSVREYDFSTDAWSEPVSAYREKGFTSLVGQVDRDHQGRVVMEMSGQGRVLEYDSQGNVVFELVTPKSDGDVYWIKQTQYIQQHTFELLRNRECGREGETG